MTKKVKKCHYCNKPIQTDPVSIRNDIQASHFCGLSIGTFLLLKKKVKQQDETISFKDPETGEYNRVLLNAIRAGYNARFLKGVQWQNARQQRKVILAKIIKEYNRVIRRRRPRRHLNKESLLNQERNEFTMEAMKTRKQAADYCGITRWQLEHIERKFPAISFKHPQTGEYDVNILDAIIAINNKQYVKSLQSEVFIMVSEIQDPAKLRTLKVIIKQIDNLKVNCQELFNGEQQQ